MTTFPLIGAGVLGCAVLVGYALALLGMRREAPWKLDEAAPGRSAAFARWLTGCYVRDGAATSSAERDVFPPRQGPLPPARCVATAPAAWRGSR